MSEFINTVDVIGDEALTDSIIDRTITEFMDDRVTVIGNNAFHGCSELAELDTPNVTRVYTRAFRGCTSLEHISFPGITFENGQSQWEGCTSLTDVYLPNITWACDSMFNGCTALKRICLPKATNINTSSFRSCTSLTYADFPSATAMARYAMEGSTNLSILILRSETLCALGETTGLAKTAIALGTGYVYVPSAMVNSYKAATNWTAYASQIRALEDYTDDGTTTGELVTGCTAITLDTTELTFTEAGTKTLVATLTPANTIDNKITWLSDNSKVAAVANGVVTARRNGTAKIIATCGDCYAECTVTVSGIEGAVTSTLYSLPTPTTFNGTSDYIDTGIKLFDTAKDFTIVCSATFANLASNKCLFHCMKETSPYPGLSLDGNSGARICYTASGTATVSVAAAATIRSLGIRYESGILNRIVYVTTSGEVKTVSISGTPAYTSIPQNLILGAYQTTDGSKGRYFNGTISVFDVYDAALPDDELTDMLLSI